MGYCTTSTVLITKYILNSNYLSHNVACPFQTSDFTNQFSNILITLGTSYNIELLGKENKYIALSDCILLPYLKGCGCEGEDGYRSKC